MTKALLRTPELAAFRFIPVITMITVIAITITITLTITITITITTCTAITTTIAIITVYGSYALMDSSVPTRVPCAVAKDTGKFC